MIDYEEELKKFQPSLDVDDVEDSIRNQELTDVLDLLREAEVRRTNREVRSR